ncbi:MAG: polynucleotide adenylyltransferase, partial [Chloroflexota bacterium]
MPQNKNLVDKLATRLPPEGLRLFDAVRSRAESSSLRAFLVGGTVRDLLLDHESLDVDIVIEGDAVQLARDVADKTGARLAKTTAFGTATL